MKRIEAVAEEVRLAIVVLRQPDGTVRLRVEGGEQLRLDEGAGILAMAQHIWLLSMGLVES